MKEIITTGDIIFCQMALCLFRMSQSFFEYVSTSNSVYKQTNTPINMKPTPVTHTIFFSCRFQHTARRLHGQSTRSVLKSTGEKNCMILTRLKTICSFVLSAWSKLSIPKAQISFWTYGRTRWHVKFCCNYLTKLKYVRKWVYLSIVPSNFQQQKLHILTGTHYQAYYEAYHYKNFFWQLCCHTEGFVSRRQLSILPL